MTSFDDTREFELEFTKKATSLTESSKKSYERILNDETKDIQKRFEAYCIMFTFYRRQKDIHECIKLFESRKTLFENSFYFNHTYSIAIKQTGRLRDLNKAAIFAQKALDIKPHHVGALHNLAAIKYLQCEAKGFQGDNNSKELSEALELTETCIIVEPNYGKFYSTKARILSAKKNYDQARFSILRAMELEDSSRHDYPLRISDYLSIKAQIELRERIETAVRHASIEIQQAVDEAKKSNFEILSFFVAVVSFIIAGINITVTFASADAVAMIFVVSAALLMSVAGFSLIYFNEGKIRKFLQISALSFFMLIVGVILKIVWTQNGW